MKLITTGRESIVEVRSTHVIKRYLPAYFEANERFGRTPEVTWYLERPIDSMPLLLDYDEKSITLENAGVPVTRRSWPLTVWLRRLLVDLQAAGVHHRDIHAGNVLQRDERFSLIDWSWATRDPSTPVPGALSDGDAAQVRRMFRGGGG